MKIKTIDVQAKEWFDKINGNSYFSALITVNFGMKSVKSFSIPFQYGYGDHYLTEARNTLKENKLIKSDDPGQLWKFCEDNNIILRTNKQEECKKRDVITFGDH